jgi:hypothetical protein
MCGAPESLHAFGARTFLVLSQQQWIRNNSCWNRWTNVSCIPRFRTKFLWLRVRRIFKSVVRNVSGTSPLITANYMLVEYWLPPLSFSPNGMLKLFYKGALYKIFLVEYCSYRPLAFHPMECWSYFTDTHCSKYSLKDIAPTVLSFSPNGMLKLFYRCALFKIFLKGYCSYRP